MQLEITSPISIKLDDTVHMLDTEKRTYVVQLNALCTLPQILQLFQKVKAHSVDTSIKEHTIED